MVKTIFFRLAVMVLFALPFGLLAVVVVHAGTSPQAPPSPEEECQTCHPAIVATWAASAHGQALTDSAFQRAWTAQGQPQKCLPCHTTGYDASAKTWVSDAITCEICHAPLAAEHPRQSMPVDSSVNLCADCHVDTVFEWQLSGHQQADLGCVDCHGQHSTTLRVEDVQVLCGNCHRAVVEDYTHSAHDEQGLLCADCHLRMTNEPPGQAHNLKDHSFTVKLESCTLCHADALHNPQAVVMAVSTPAALDVETMGVSLDPSPVSPAYYALIAALLGMAFGLVLSPWLERWYCRLNR